MFNLTHSADGLGKKGKLIWELVRFFVPQNTMFFFEGNRNISGQLWYAERKLLYSIVHSYKSNNCFKICT